MTTASLRAARERPAAPILAATPDVTTARRLVLVWGVHALPSLAVGNVDEMIEVAVDATVREGFAKPGSDIVVVAGLPFGRAGTTNLLHVARVASGG